MARDRGEKDNAPAQKLPKGIVLGKDGKPCRTCTDVASWKALTRGSSKSQTKTSSSSFAAFSSSAAASSSIPTTTTTTNTPPECPPDVAALGRSTWTLLHSMSATYPSQAPPALQNKTCQFLSLFSELYPCWVCAEDLQEWMARPGNEPKVAGRDEFGKWMCEAHNEVNRKLGKEVFDCGLWKERWRDGWRDGSCD